VAHQTTDYDQGIDLDETQLNGGAPGAAATVAALFVLKEIEFVDASIGDSAIPYSESPLNSTGIGATEDDVSVLWLKPGASISAAVELLESNATAIGLGEIFYGPTLWLNYGNGSLDPGQDPRIPECSSPIQISRPPQFPQPPPPHRSRRRLSKPWDWSREPWTRCAKRVPLYCRRSTHNSRTNAIAQQVLPVRDCLCGRYPRFVATAVS
jgi:hypothetical protein